MNFLKLLLLLSFVLISPSCSEVQVGLHFASQKEAKQMIVEEDCFVKGWGQFDLDSRLGRSGATREEVLRFLEDQCLEFSQSEQDTISLYFQQIMETAEQLGLNLPLPEEVVFVKTTSKEEGGAGGYTRSNRIYLNEVPHDAAYIKAFFAHELFHVLTRNSIAFKKAIYQTIGFEVLDDEIPFSKDIVDLRISNPDVTKYDSYAMLTIDGEKQPCTMMLQANRPYEGGSFFHYLQIGLIPLDQQFKPIMADGETVIYQLEQCSDFFDHVGKNTQYVINPEEALADNFSFLFMDIDLSQMPTPEIIEAIKTACQNFK